ncbi:sugar lactone lactonase YvrE [Pontibacter aydingkolensis]|uniref:SMP-30/gluconolactonase/LRE family protein n=1 Tax=Pontibacter aydingkolensis TaxID=1911536 RepID=A0ABS7D0S7_9BACT|nr:SMP-30/gluconolactonase/LRE family protein [Pontibacter aydingkolensis]MBW7469257.1 SMP-30/gluconolactonase/LRE family protein [Pontibacter aydingkolensis]
MTQTSESAAGLTAALELDAGARLGEGALWHPTEQCLYWVDIEGRALHIYNPETKQDRVLHLGERIGTVVPVEGGGALVALQNGIHYLHTDSGKLSFITNPIKEKDIRFNDGKCDPSGRFWVGTMALDTREGVADLYMLDHDCFIHHMLGNLTISNGIAWTQDKKTAYFTDTPTQTVKAFAYNDASGQISEGKVIIKIPKEEGSPDGMTLDAEGNLWIALHGGGAVAKYNPETGEQLQKVNVPAINTTSCAFGGKDLDTLYITTGRDGVGEEELRNYPYHGGLFSVKPDVRGIPASFYKGDVRG